MKKRAWRTHHKWLGLVLGFFIVMFAVSGLVLNHFHLFSNINISRTLLPSEYLYRQWNNGLLRGSVLWNKQVLVYGNNGIWQTNAEASYLKDFNKGLPQGVDHRQIRGIAKTSSEDLFALGQYGLYRWQANKGWQKVYLPQHSRSERLSDITIKGDSLLVIGRSYIYLATPPYKKLITIMLPPAANDDGKVSLFRTIWLLHSGELFGTIGVLLVDAIALVLIFLTITGVVCWLLPYIRKEKRKLLSNQFPKWHNKIGKLTIVCTIGLCITGWFLRPPALIAIASGRIPPLPFTTMDSDNPWHDELRLLRYDNEHQDWLLYTSNGFYTMKNLHTTPKPEYLHPPVSVMGINVAEKNNDGKWLIGSFSGLYRWDRTNNRVTDYYTGQPAKETKGIPFSDNAISGYSDDFSQGIVVADYHHGTEVIKMPQWMAELPISLRNVCIEVHTGRIYTFMGKGYLLYIFVMGITIFWCIWTGWKIRHRNR